MTIDNVEITAVHDAIVTAIAGIAPTIAFSQSYGWTYAEAGRAVEGSGRVRHFWLEWGAPQFVFAGLTGRANTEIAVPLDVITSYRMMPAELVDRIRITDVADLHDALHNRLDGAPSGIPGLTGVTYNDTLQDGEAAQLQVAYSFEIRFMRVRR